MTVPCGRGFLKFGNFNHYEGNIYERHGDIPSTKQTLNSDIAMANA